VRDLLFSITKKDFTFQYFTAGGKGGQHQNKVHSAVRVIHKDSGARAESRKSRHQHENKKIAFRKLITTDTFKKWHRIKSAEMNGKIKTKEQLCKEVEASMTPENLKVEYYKPK